MDGLNSIFASWQFLAVACTLIWAACSVVDRFFVSAKARNSGVMLVYTGIANVFVVAVFALFFGLVVPTLPILAVLLASGAFWAFAAALYYATLKRQDVSSAMPVLKLDTIFLAILAFVFLGESFGLLTYAGIAMVVAGAILVSLKKSGLGRFTFDKAFWLAVGSALLFAVSELLLKAGVGGAVPVQAFLWQRIGSIAVYLVLGVFHAREFTAGLSRHRKASAVLLFSSTVSVLAGLLLAMAFVAFYATLVNTVTAVRPLLIVVFTLLLARFKPSILKENFDKRTLVLKAAAAVLVVVGSWLVMG